MKSDIIVIGGGASGLMAAYSAAATAVAAGSDLQVTVLEKMPRPGRKLMLTGKGRCNFTNTKPWNDFSSHIQSGSRLAKSAFYALPSDKVIGFFESFGLRTVVERGDRAFPESYRASDVVDTLVNACHSVGVKIETGAEVTAIETPCGNHPDKFRLRTSDSREWSCRKLIIATGGLSYPSTGSTGDGLVWASETGHAVTATFPSLTALVPHLYKVETPKKSVHIDRNLPLSAFGEKFCGVQLKNVRMSLFVQGTEVAGEFGDVDFTDGGIEGPVGFLLSRRAVKALVNGSKVALSLDMKPAVELPELSERISALWDSIGNDPRSRRLRVKDRYRVLLGKLLPLQLCPAFRESHSEMVSGEKVALTALAEALKDWRFDIDGFVGYERAVVTAGGVAADGVVAKTMESRLVGGLYFCGEVLDIDADTGGYNLQLAFSTGSLAGSSAASAAQRIPSMADETMPPEYPAPSPQG